MELLPFDSTDDTHLARALALWNDAHDPRLPLSEKFLRFNLQPAPGVRRAGCFALAGGQPAGFVLASAFPDAPPALHPESGWLDAIAVATAFQRQGIGSALLAWAHEWLAGQGMRHVLAGGGLRPFTPGVLADGPAEGFLRARGYTPGETPHVWDVARNLRDYTPPDRLQEVPAAVRPAQPGQEQLLLDFLAQEFPGRWHWDAATLLADGGRISDFMLLWTAEGVQGACRLTFEDSSWPIERYYPYPLPRPWGQLGFIGVAAHLRGQGMGLALLDGGLRRLHSNGVNGCVIDWTSLLDFYAICGFQPFQKWARLEAFGL